MAASRNQRGRLVGNFRRAKGAPRRAPNLCRLGFEPLEDRRLLSITWTNRGVPGFDFDGFQGVFGANAELARNTAQGALDLWGRVITNLNQSGGVNQLDVSINMQSTGVGFGGSGAVTSLIGNKPRTGAILLNRGNDGNNDGIGDGVNWFLDPTPLDNSEYNNGAIINPFAALPNPGSGIAADFMSLVTVELAHILGVANNNGLAWKNNAFVTNTNQPDVRDAPGTLWRFDGPTISGLLTSNNGGGGGTETGLPVHVAYTPNQYFGPTKFYSGVADVGTAGGDASIRYLPSKLMVHMLSDVYGYTINEPESFGTFFAMLQGNGQLRIRGGLPTGLNFPSSDSILVFADGANIHVDLDLGNDVAGTGISGIMHSGFLKSQVASVRIDAGDGDDSIHLGSLQSNLPITLIGGTGSDTLEVDGTSGNDVFTVGFSSLTTAGINITSTSSIDTLVLTPGLGADDVYAPGSLSTVFRINLPSAASTLNLHSLSQFGAVTIYGSAANNTINIAPNGGANAIQSNVTVYGAAGADTLTVGGGNLDSVMGLVTFDGGGAPVDTEDRVILNDQSNSFSLNYNLTASSLTRDKPLSFGGLNYSNISRIILNGTQGPNTFRLANDIVPTVEAHGNNGDDNFIVGDGNVGFLPAWILDGAGGNDAITFDNHLASINHTVEFQPNLVIFYNGVFSISTVGFETVGWLGGFGNDQVRISGTMSQGLNLDAGLGNDTIVVGYSSQSRFFGNATINGGAGNDNIYWNRASNNWYEALFGTLKYDVMIDGGTGYNTLAIDETTRSAAGYYLYADRFYATDGAAFPVGFDINYDNMQAMSLSAGGGTTNVGVYGTSSDIDIGNQISIALGGGNDNVYLYPHDAQGNLTIKGNIGIGGGAGTDSLFVVDSASPAPAAYAFANPFGAGTQNITGVGSGGFGIGSDFEAITMTGSVGDDVYNINSYKSGMALTINGGLGDDVCNFGNDNLSANITSIAAFTFDGQDGYDTFNLNNAANSLAWQYGVFTTAITAAQSTYNLQLSNANLERLGINAGAGNDSAVVYGQAPGVLLTVNGGNGNDTLTAGGGSLTLETIHGPIQFAGEGGADNRVNLFDYTDATGDVGHLDQNTIGSFAGDNLFGAGGSLYFSSIARLDLNCGSGADTIYAQPNVSASLFLNGNNPTTAPGDTLNLALAGAVNYVLTPTSATAGNVTSDNLKTLTWSGFETGPIVDDAAPFIVAQSYDDSVVPTIVVEFSEDVSSALGVASLELLNTTTNEQIAFGLIALSYDAGTNIASFTFPGYPDGVLPPGDYTATIDGAVTDFFGNALGVETPFSFQVVGPPSADFDGDDIVDGADFLAWQRGLGIPAPDAIKADGDADNDRDVDGDDLAVWQAQFGVAGAAVAASAADAAAASLAEPILRPSGALSADLVDLAVAQESAAHSIGDRARRSHAFIEERIIFGGPYRSLRPGFDAASERQVVAQLAARSPSGVGRATDEFFVRGIDNARLDAGVLEDLIERLS